jgi:hypothetical protein
VTYEELKFQLSKQQVEITKRIRTSSSNNNEKKTKVKAK